MCVQMTVLKKIREKGEVNGFAVDLAEAQAQDYVKMSRRVDNIEKDVKTIKKEQARQGGMIQAIFDILNGPIEQQRKDGIFWAELKSIAKTPLGKIMILLAIGCIALAGTRILELMGVIKSLG